MLALTALAAHHRSRWCNLVLGDDAAIEVEVLDAHYRPVEMQTTRDELKGIIRTRISVSRDLKLTLLFESC